MQGDEQEKAPKVSEWVRRQPGKIRDRRFQDVIDDAIETAMKEGAFDNLPGKGKPIKLDDNPFERDRWLEHHILSNAHFAPEWVELQKEIRAELAWVRRHPDHPERQERIEKLNAKIDRFNLLVPSVSLQLPRYRA